METLADRLRDLATLLETLDGDEAVVAAHETLNDLRRETIIPFRTLDAFRIKRARRNLGWS